MNKEKRNKYSTSLIILIVLISLLTPSSLALAEVTRTKLNNVDNNGDFVVGPGKTEIFVNPGETITKNITITSRIDKPVMFGIGVEDFVGSDNPNETVVLLGDSKSPYSLKDLIRPEISSFTLEFGEQIVIPITISIPANAEPRGYYGAVLVSNEPDKSINPVTGKALEGSTKIISRVGSLFLIRVNGPSNESGQLVDFGMMEPKKKFYSSKPRGFEILFENEGNVHLIPYGEISVTNILGKEVTRLPADAYFVLPESTRARQILWNNDFFGIGRYKASLSLYKGYGNENDLEEDFVTFWVIPWKIIVGVFVTLFILITIIYYLISRFEIKKKK